MLEDVQPFPVVAYDLGSRAPRRVDYIADQSRPEHAGRSAGSARASRIRCTATTPSSSPPTSGFSNNWSLQASYRWSRLRGTFEGFFRDDNGQSDPGITSLYDFPTNDPSYTAIGVPQFGYQGDIRFLGALGDRDRCRSTGRTRSSCTARTRWTWG